MCVCYSKRLEDIRYETYSRRWGAHRYMRKPLRDSLRLHRRSSRFWRRVDVLHPCYRRPVTLTPKQKIPHERRFNIQPGLTCDDAGSEDLAKVVQKHFRPLRDVTPHGHVRAFATSHWTVDRCDVTCYSSHVLRSSSFET